jgi:hypothetical protein
MGQVKEALFGDKEYSMSHLPLVTYSKKKKNPPLFFASLLFLSL